MDNAPTARNSSTDIALLDETIDQIHNQPETTQLPCIPERLQSVITCPTGTCDLKSIEELPSIEANLDDAYTEEVFSPSVSQENYPILFNFVDIPQSQIDYDADKEEAPQLEVVQPPPKPNDTTDTHNTPYEGRSRRFPRVDYAALHEYGRHETGQQGGPRERRDRECRGAPD